MSWKCVTRAPGCLLLPLPLLMSPSVSVCLFPRCLISHLSTPGTVTKLKDWADMNGGNDGLERFAPAPIEDSEVVVGTILFGLMSSVSYLLVQPPCPEAFLGIPRLRAGHNSLVLQDLIPTLFTTMANFSPFLNSLPMLFHLSRMPFPLFLCLGRGVLAGNEGGSLAM